MIKSKLKKIIRDAADKKYTKKIDISFIDGVGLYNHSCHLNAVNRARAKLVAKCHQVVSGDRVECYAFHQWMKSGVVSDVD